MGYTEDIISIAKDIALCRIYPARSNNPKRRPFRAVVGMEDEMPNWPLDLPFGFEFHSAPIEVHVSIEMRRVKGTGIFAKVPVLSIYGVLKDGCLHLIAKDVKAITGVVE